MTPEERTRAGEAIRLRLDEMGLSIAAFAALAHVHESTMRRVMAGQVWPHQSTRDKLSAALGWPAGEVARRAMSPSPLHVYTTAELVGELCYRFHGVHRAEPGKIHAFRARHAEAG